MEHYSGSAGVGGGVWDIILGELGKLGWVEHYFGWVGKYFGWMGVGGSE